MSIVIGNNLTFARLINNLSLTELSEKIGCTKQYLEQIEKKIFPDNYKDEFVKKISNILLVNDKFFIENTLSMPISNCFYFRSQKTSTERSKNFIKLTSCIISTFFSFFKDNYNLNVINIGKFEHNCNNDIEKISENIRKKLGLSIDTPINNMMLEMERMDFKIIEYKDTYIDNKIDACFSDIGEKIILINLNKISSGCRYRFSLAHELGHALLHSCDDDNENEKIEDEANYFASCFLLPRAGFLREFNFLTKCRIDWSLLYEQKRRWKVSVQAMLKRALLLGIIDNSKYTSAMMTIAKHGERFHEKYDDENTIPFEKPIVIKQYENLLQEDYYIVDSFLQKYSITLELLNKILNFNLVNTRNKVDNIIYISKKQLEL